MTENPFRRLGVTDEEFAEALKKSAEIDEAGNKFMKTELVPLIQSYAPVRTGEFVGSIKVLKKMRGGKGAVGSKDFKARWIEYGTKEAGRHHATRAFAPFGKAAHHFGGTLEEGVALDTGDDDTGGE